MSQPQEAAVETNNEVEEISEDTNILEIPEAKEEEKTEPDKSKETEDKSDASDKESEKENASEEDKNLTVEQKLERANHFMRENEKKWKAAEAAREKDKADAEKYRAELAAKKTPEEVSSDELAAIKEENRQLKRGLLISKVLSKHNLTEDAEEFITADDEEAADAQAAKLAGSGAFKIATAPVEEKKTLKPSALQGNSSAKDKTINIDDALDISFTRG